MMEINLMEMDVQLRGLLSTNGSEQKTSLTQAFVFHCVEMDSKTMLMKSEMMTTTSMGMDVRPID